MILRLDLMHFGNMVTYTQDGAGARQNASQEQPELYQAE